MPLGTLTAGGGSASAADASADWTMWYDVTAAPFRAAFLAGFYVVLFVVCYLLFVVYYLFVVFTAALQVPALPSRRPPAAHDAVVRDANAVCGARLQLQLPQLRQVCSAGVSACSPRCALNW
jgi:hypothetical protein